MREGAVLLLVEALVPRLGGVVGPAHQRLGERGVHALAAELDLLHDLHRDAVHQSHHGDGARVHGEDGGDEGVDLGKPCRDGDAPGAGQRAAQDANRGEEGEHPLLGACAQDREHEQHGARAIQAGDEHVEVSRLARLQENFDGLHLLGGHDHGARGDKGGHGLGRRGLTRCAGVQNGMCSGCQVG